MVDNLYFKVKFAYFKYTNINVKIEILVQNIKKKILVDDFETLPIAVLWGNYRNCNLKKKQLLPSWMIFVKNHE